MFRIAIVETDTISKDLLFEIGKILQDYDWTFSCFPSIMDFFKKEKCTTFDVVILHEQYQTNRIYESLIKHKTYQVIFTYDHVIHQLFPDVSYLSRKNISSQTSYLKDLILPIIKRQEPSFMFDREISFMIKPDDIQYIEKQDKLLIFHTSRGELKSRGNMIDMVSYYKEFDFIQTHVSYLVNMQFIFGLDHYEIIMKDYTRIPISRHRHKKIKEYLHNKTLHIQ